MTEWKQPKRRGALSPEQPNYKDRRLYIIRRRHRVWLREQDAGAPSADDGWGGSGSDPLFD